MLDVFDGIVMSGAEGVTKPDPAIFALLCDRYRVAPGEAVFVDDSPTNVSAAQRFGLQAVLFRDADRLCAISGARSADLAHAFRTRVWTSVRVT